MNTFEDEANDVLVNAVYAERLIQYGNRYRKDHNNVDKSLNEAERLFKNNRYKRSIEISEQALESVEPGITKYIEDESQRLITLVLLTIKFITLVSNKC